MMDDLLRKIALYSLMAFHNVSMFVVLFGPYLTNDLFFLILLIAYNIALITGWYIFNGCWLTQLEQQFQDDIETYENGNEKSYVSTFLQDMLGIDEKIVYYFITFVPVFNSAVGLYKIYFINSYAIKMSSSSVDNF